MTSVAPNTALTSASMDWGVYYTYAVQCMLDGTAIDTDWCKGFAEGADKITPLNDKVVAEGTEEKVKEVAEVLYDQALLIEGFPIEDPIAYSRKICELLVNTNK